jgi:hypothetical protein
MDYYFSYKALIDLSSDKKALRNSKRNGHRHQGGLKYL